MDRKKSPEIVKVVIRLVEHTLKEELNTEGEALHHGPDQMTFLRDGPDSQESGPRQVVVERRLKPREGRDEVESMIGTNLFAQGMDLPRIGHDPGLQGPVHHGPHVLHQTFRHVRRLRT